MKKLFLFSVLFSALSLYSQAQKIETIKPIQKIHLKVPEPSDVSETIDHSGFWIISDHGVLYKIDYQGNVITKVADYKGRDCEGVYAMGDSIYVADEFTRRVGILDANTLKLAREVPVPFYGGRNQSYEAITFNEATQRLVLFTEKWPALARELNANFQIENEVNISSLARDISGATFHDGYMWLLSDEDQKVMKVNPITYKLIKAWHIPVLNPEGIVFDHKGQLVIVSDAMHTLFYFNAIQ